MKQFCPKCCEWFDIDERFCPACDVGLYFESECETATKIGKKLEILSRQKADRLYSKGVFQVVTGIILIFATLTMIILDAIPFASELNEILGMLLGVLILISPCVGLFIAAIGIASIRTYNSFKRTTQPSTYNPVNQTTQSPIVLSNKPIIYCPYCKSDNTVKIDTISRMGSIFIAGAASGKIGKQWHCNNCKSDF